MVLSDENMDMVCATLKGITEALNRNNETLEKILGHYNSVVPPMKEGADRSNRIGREVELQNGAVGALGGHIEN